MVYGMSVSAIKKHIPFDFHFEKLQVKQKISSFIPVKVQKVASRVSPLARDTLIKLGIAISINCLIMTFFAVPFGVPITLAWMNHALLLSAFYAIPKVAFDMYFQHRTKDLLTKGVNEIAGFSIVNSLGLGGLNPWIHELGHALAAISLFKRPEVSIIVKPFSHGETSYYVSNGLTRLGQMLGKEKCILFTTAAGIMASTLFGMTEFACAYGIQDRYPTLSHWMNYHALSQIMNDVVYGMTAFIARRSDLSHDFVRLWQTGQIHPLIPISLMIALPLLEVALFELLEHRKRSKEIQRVANEKNFSNNV
jgi:hypothetical protein